MNGFELRATTGQQCAARERFIGFSMTELKNGTRKLVVTAPSLCFAFTETGAAPARTPARPPIEYPDWEAGGGPVPLPLPGGERKNPVRSY